MNSKSFQVTPVRKHIGSHMVWFFVYYHHSLDGPVVRPLAVRAKGPGFNSPIAQHVQILIFSAVTYGAVDSLVLSWSWA